MYENSTQNFHLEIPSFIIAYSKSFLNVTRVSVATWSISLHWNYSRPAGQDSHLHLQYSCSSCATDDSVHLDITNRNNMIIDNLMANQWYYIYVYELYDGDIVENCSATFKVKTAEDGRSYISNALQ
jgi:hypothetical protein